MVWGVGLIEMGVPLHTSAPAALVSALGAVIISPDLDQDGLTKSETSILKRSRILGWAWFLYWLPYAKAIRHRHWLSHAPIIGTTIRLLYLSPLWYLLFVKLGLAVSEWAPYAVGGLMVLDLCHWLRDGMLRRSIKKTFREEMGM